MTEKELNEIKIKWKSNSQYVVFRKTNSAPIWSPRFGMKASFCNEKQKPKRTQKFCITEEEGELTSRLVVNDAAWWHTVVVENGATGKASATLKHGLPRREMIDSRVNET